MKGIILIITLFLGLSSFGQSLSSYISVKDSLPEYANTVAVLLPGKESNELVGDNCPILAQYIWAPGGGFWVTADRQPWKTKATSKGRKRIRVTYWYPLPMERVERTNKKG